MRSIVIALLAPLAAQAGCLRGEWYAVKPNGKYLTRPTKHRGKDLYAPYDSTGAVALCSKR